MIIILKLLNIVHIPKRTFKVLIDPGENEAQSSEAIYADRYQPIAIVDSKFYYNGL